MDLKLLLISSPVTLEERYGILACAGSTQPSFGLASLAAIAQRSGARVQVLDAAAENLSVDQCLQEILELAPDVVGISSTTVGIVAAAELAARIKAHLPKVVVVLGGCHATALPEQTLSEFPGFDVVVIGEGEVTFKELLEAITRNTAIVDDIPGTAVRSNGTIRVNRRRPFLDNLDVLPLPAWSLVRGFPGAFRPSPLRVKRYPCASIVLTRGCPNRCLFCDRSVFGNRCRSYSPAYAFEMLKDLRETYRVREVLLEDDTFVTVKSRVRELCERLIASRLDLTWSCLGRVDSVSQDLLRLMRKAGCWHISYGIESGDPTILDAMGKNVDLQQVANAVQWSKEAGLQTKGFFMIGFPNETHASIAASLDLAKRLPLDDISVAYVTPFPGSDLYAVAGQYGQWEDDWRKMNLLQTVFVPWGFTKGDLVAARNRMFRQFYFRPRPILRKLRQVISHPSTSWAMAKGLAAWFKVVRSRKP